MRQQRFHISKCYAGIAAVAAAIVAAMLILFPGGQPWPATFVLTAAAGAVAFGALRLLCPRSNASDCILLAAWTLLGIGLALNAWWFTTANGGTPRQPVFYNDDAAIVWQQLKAVVDGGDAYGIRSRGYALFLSILCFGKMPAVQTVLVINVLMTLLSIVFAGAAACRCIDGDNDGDNDSAAARRRRTISAAAMTAMAANCYFLSSGALIIKDAACTMLMSLLLLLLACLRCPRQRTAAILLVPLCAAICIVRPHMLLFAMLAMALWILAVKAKQRCVIGVALLLSAAAYVVALRAGHSSELIRDSGADADISFYVGDNDDPRLAAYSAISPRYDNLDIDRKLVRLPFSLAVQYFTPLPWAFGRHTAFGPAQAWAHMAYPWYATGAVFLFYCLFCFRASPLPVRLSALFAIAAWICTAYTTGGTVSRYCLPWLPFIALPAAWVVAAGKWRSPAFRRWCIASAIVLATVLITIYLTINRYSPDGWTAQ